MVSNRFFIYVEIPFVNEKRKIVMDDDMDSQLIRLPELWDYNFNANSNIFDDC